MKNIQYIRIIRRVLIDTWWNVNRKLFQMQQQRRQVLIDTWWNVNGSVVDQASMLSLF